MKFTLSWLKDHLETEATLDEVVEKLTVVGLEVEEVSDLAAELSVFVVGHVVEARQHPNADRLRLCMVDSGSGDPVQVICGAPNARTGMKGFCACRHAHSRHGPRSEEGQDPRRRVERHALFGT